MEAVRFHQHGGVETLQVDEIDRPEPGPEQVLVDVAASAVNPVDTYFREGAYETGDLPWIAGSDLAGIVHSVGESVEEFESGDRVFGTGMGMTLSGTCAEFVTAPPTHLAKLPEAVEFTTGAALGLVGVTAWQSLIEACGLEPAERCLIHGGNGGVGHVAIQLAAATGAAVTTTAAQQYHDKLDELGAETVFDYDRDDLATAIEAAGPPDVILDHRLDEYLGLDTEVAISGARIAAIGNESPEACFPNVPQCRAKSLSLFHTSMFAISDYRPVLRRLAHLAGAGDVVPKIDRTFDLADVPAAQDAIVSESFLGKLAIRV